MVTIFSPARLFSMLSGIDLSNNIPSVSELPKGKKVLCERFSRKSVALGMPAIARPGGKLDCTEANWVHSDNLQYPTH